MFPSPPPDPLQRLHVYDGLMMNTRRWLIAEGYQRRRQNLQFQSINQPGVVWGLGVRVIEPPETVDARFRDDRWIEIQPGMAIDLDGNPIIVDPETDRTYRIDAKPPDDGRLTVYIVVSYVEPEQPNGHPDETVREWFRFDQITHPPDGRQVELCRIQLTEPVHLAAPDSVFSPRLNQLDFRYRLAAKPRSQAIVRAGLIGPSQKAYDASDLATYTLYKRSAENLSELMRAVGSLYPTLDGDPVCPLIPLRSSNLSDYDLLFLPDDSLLGELTPAELKRLQKYLQNGGGLLVEAFPEPASGPSAESAPQRLLRLLSNGAPTSSMATWDDLSRHHPLRRSPFLFGALPCLSTTDLQLHIRHGIVVLEGQLSAAWGLASGLHLPRADIRTAHELGVNLLHFFWRRRQLIQLWQWENASKPHAPTVHASSNQRA